MGVDPCAEDQRREGCSVQHRTLRPWPGGEDRTALTYRYTDRALTVPGTGTPLSVSAAYLGVTAMRCALLQDRWASEAWQQPAPRDGSGRLVEVYPKAALRAWGMDPKGYKGGPGDRAAKARESRRRIVDELAQAVERWLDLGPVEDLCVDSGHVLDGLVSALVAVAAKSDATQTASDAEVPMALLEGWIHVPTEALSDLEPSRMR